MGHWYDRDGKPVYQVPMADGKRMRDTHIGDARKRGLVASVTSILGVVDKPALTRWKQEQIMKAVLLRPYNPHQESEEAWKKIIYMMSQQEGKEAAERGNLIHDALEHFYKGKGLEEDMKEYCVPVVELLQSKFGNIEWIAEDSFMHPLGFGGKCDLHAKPSKEFPNGVVLDFKTKSAEDFSKVKAYDEQCMQVVAYREGFKIPKAACYDLFISTKTVNTMMLHEWPEEECVRNWDGFKHLVEYWKISNKFEVKVDTGI